jgi:hypothetical protein
VDASTAAELLKQAAEEPDPAVRRLILDRVGRLRLPGVREALERHVAADPDPRAALTASERSRIEQSRKLSELFEKRRLSPTPIRAAKPWTRSTASSRPTHTFAATNTLFNR